MKKLFKVMAPVLVLFMGIATVMTLGATKPKPEKKDEAPRLVSLYVDEVVADEVTLSVNTQGEVRAKTEIDLYPQLSGRIVSVSTQFAEGAAFEPQATLIKIDDEDYKLALIRAEARVAEANVKLEMEKADAAIKEKQRKMYNKSSNVAPLALNLPQVKEAEAKLRSAQADLAEAQLNLARTEISVPFKGRVITKDIGVGQYVSPGTKLGRVFSTDTVEIVLPLTDSQLVELNLPIGFEAGEDNAPVVTFSTNVGSVTHQWTGRIVRTHASIDEQTRLISAVAEVSDPYGAAVTSGMPLAVGMFVSASIDGVNSQNALVVPRDALRNEDKVYVINEDNKLEIRTVAVLSTSTQRVLVTDGVEAGERVVTSSLPNAFEGMAVQPLTRQMTVSL